MRSFSSRWVTSIEQKDPGLAEIIVFFWGKDIFRPKFRGSARISQL